MNDDNLAKNLIKALGKLQHATFESDIIHNEAVSADSVEELFFAFAIGVHNFVVSANSFCEVIVESPIAVVPNAPSLLAGLCNARGVLLPVYQLHTAFEAPLPAKPIIFSIGRGEKAVALLVDNLPVSISLSTRDMVAGEKNTSHPVSGFFSVSGYFSKNQHWNLIDGTAIARQLLEFAQDNYKQQSRMGHPVTAI